MLSFTPGALKHLFGPVVFFTILLLFAMLGPIAQLEHYHDFADQRYLIGFPNTLDVLSNIAFLFVALFGVWHFVRKVRSASNLKRHDYAYLIFTLCLFSTSIASTYYHLHPDDARLFWDRLPIALACAALIVAIRLETHYRQAMQLPLIEIGLIFFAAFGSVVWWKLSGDLRWYLAIQAIVILCLPILQITYSSSSLQRYSLIGAIILYTIAKLVESFDHVIFNQLTWMSGHTIKHLISAAAALLLLWQWQKQE
jgi:hypothetical protein